MVHVPPWQPGHLAWPDARSQPIDGDSSDAGNEINRAPPGLAWLALSTHQVHILKRCDNPSERIRYSLSCRLVCPRHVHRRYYKGELTVTLAAAAAAAEAAAVAADVAEKSAVIKAAAAAESEAAGKKALAATEVGIRVLYQTLGPGLMLRGCAFSGQA